MLLPPLLLFSVQYRYGRDTSRAVTTTPLLAAIVGAAAVPVVAQVCLVPHSHAVCDPLLREYVATYHRTPSWRPQRRHGWHQAGHPQRRLLRACCSVGRVWRRRPRPRPPMPRQWTPQMTPCRWHSLLLLLLHPPLCRRRRCRRRQLLHTTTGQLWLQQLLLSLPPPLMRRLLALMPLQVLDRHRLPASSGGVQVQV